MMRAVVLFPTAPPALLGQHTEEILRHLLRIPKAKVEKLRAAGVV